MEGCKTRLIHTPLVTGLGEPEAGQARKKLRIDTANSSRESGLTQHSNFIEIVEAPGDASVETKSESDSKRNRPGSLARLVTLGKLRHGRPLI